MAISLLEYLLLGIPIYTTFILILWSSLGANPVTRSMAGIRLSCVAPVLVFTAALMVMDPSILIYEETKTTIETFDYEALDSGDSIVVLNSTKVISEYNAPTINLQNYSWSAIHGVFFFIFLFYIISNAFSILKKTD